MKEYRILSTSELNQELSWSDVLKLFSKRKRLLLALFAIFFSIGLGYIASKKSNYYSDIILLSPTDSDIAALNDLRFESPPLKPHDLLTMMVNELRAAALQEEFFANHSGKPPEISFTRPSTGELKIHIESSKPDKLARSLNTYIASLEQRVKAELIRERQVGLEQGMRKLTANKEQRLRQAKYQREHKLALLQESLSIAEKIGLKDGVLVRPGITAGLGPLQLPTYSLGTKAIEAEIETFKARGNDKTFIPGVYALEAKIEGLRDRKLTQDQFSVFKNLKPATKAHEKKQAYTPFLTALLFGSFFLAFICTFMIGLMRDHTI